MKHTHFILPLIALPGLASAASLLTGGHIDGPAFGYESGSGFEPHYHNEGGASGAVVDGVVQTVESEYEPDELIVVIPELSTTTVDTVSYYWLPEDGLDAENAGAPFLGIGLEELDPDDWDGLLTLTLLSFDGPGDFLLWQDDGLGGTNIFLDTADNVLSFQIAPGSHTHFNWGFTDNAFFNLEFEISGEHETDAAQNGSAIYSFMVPEPSTVLMSALGAAALLRRRR